jgi:hypothetical protein
VSESSFHWSLGANWLAGEMPTPDATVRTLTFPRLGSACEAERPAEVCYESYNDVSGLSAEALRLDNANDYVIAGDQISIGSGGLTASPASGPVGPAGDVIAAPLKLSSSQTWNVKIEATSATLDPTSRLEFNIVGSGATAKIDYSQLVSQGAIALAGANLGVVVRPPAGEPCPTLIRGHTYTFVSTTGTLSGAFSNAPVGGPELPVRYADACPAKSQTMRIGYHESGAVQTVTGTVEEDALNAEEDAIARHGAEEAAKHGAAEEAFAGRRAEEEATAKRRTEEAVATATGAAATIGPSQGVAAFTTSVDAKVPDVRLAATDLVANRAGYVSFGVSCPVGESRCGGTLILRTSNTSGAHSSAAKRSAALLRLATGQFSVPGGHTTTVVLRLTPRARLLLHRMHLLRARVTIVTHYLPGAWHTSVASVTIRAGRPG